MALNPARIGRVTFSQTGRTLYYGGLTFQSLKGRGFKSNYYCVETGEDYWISDPERRGGRTPIAGFEIRSRRGNEADGFAFPGFRLLTSAATVETEC